MKKTAHLHKQSLITVQDVVHVIILIAISLLFCFVPALGFAQAVPGNISSGAFSALDFPQPSLAQPVTAANPTSTVSDSVVPFSDFETTEFTAPTPVAAPVSPVTANQFQQVHSQPLLMPQRNVQYEMVTPSEHPFARYWGVPNDPQTKIVGKPLSVTELFAGTRSPAVRRQLLQAYWELSGLLAIYHFRCETEKLAVGSSGSQEGMLLLLREQRRSAEVEFIKQQWILAEILKQHKGQILRESAMPIPSDYPLYQRYQTFADKIARTERTQYLGRMIPIQEQLVESKYSTWKVASEMIQSASQPFFATSNQRTKAFLDLIKAIVEYNKMIAEYALETIPPNISHSQLVGAVVRLPKQNTTPEQPQSPPMTATQEIKLTQYEMPQGITAQPVMQIASEFKAVPDFVTTPAFTMPENDKIEETETVPEFSPILQTFR